MSVGRMFVIDKSLIKLTTANKQPLSTSKYIMSGTSTFTDGGRECEMKINHGNKWIRRMTRRRQRRGWKRKDERTLRNYSYTKMRGAFSSFLIKSFHESISSGFMSLSEFFMRNFQLV